MFQELEIILLSTKYSKTLENSSHVLAAHHGYFLVSAMRVIGAVLINLFFASAKPRILFYIESVRLGPPSSRTVLQSRCPVTQMKLEMESQFFFHLGIPPPEAGEYELLVTANEAWTWHASESKYYRCDP
jgi:hypothetical protein